LDVWVCFYLIYARYHLLILLTDDKSNAWIVMIMTQDISIIRPDLIARIHALCEGEDDSIAIMATISAELFHAVDGYDWVGFYRVVAPNLLKIGPYQGGHGCLVIPFDRGVCGSAARQRAIQLVDDVDRFEGHIACSSSTKSELVIPCFNQGDRLLGVLDIDSDQPHFFKWQDAYHIDQVLRQLFQNATS
jgi:L-methionine (R)-S-oxide reductase